MSTIHLSFHHFTYPTHSAYHIFVGVLLSISQCISPFPLFITRRIKRSSLHRRPTHKIMGRNQQVNCKMQIIMIYWTSIIQLTVAQFLNLEIRITITTKLLWIHETWVIWTTQEMSHTMEFVKKSAVSLLRQDFYVNTNQINSAFARKYVICKYLLA
jgi:hypothetical protein